jgi:actin-related protein
MHAHDIREKGANQSAVTDAIIESGSLGSSDIKVNWVLVANERCIFPNIVVRKDSGDRVAVT